MSHAIVPIPSQDLSRAGLAFRRIFHRKHQEPEHTCRVRPGRRAILPLVRGSRHA
jgi:hypothetical protein